MDLSIYDVIKKVSMTGKASDLFDKQGKFTFEVNRASNKIIVREAVEKIWNVKVKNVRMINLKGKSKLFARKPFQTAGKKKAIVTLKKGYKIDIPGLFETMGASGSSVKSDKEK